MKMKTALLEEMNWMEAKQAIKDAGGIAIIPIGCLEQWGAFPLGCDTYQCVGHVKKLVELAQKDRVIKQIVVAPMVPYGYQPMMKDFPGTVHIRSEVMREFFRDIAESLVRHGVMKFIWISGHGASCIPLIDMAMQLKDKYGTLTVLDRGYRSAGEERGPRPAGAPQSGHGSGSMPWGAVPPETLKRCRAQQKTWLTAGRTFYPWGTDDFTDVSFDHDILLNTAKLKTSRTSRGEPISVFIVGHWQEFAPFGSIGDPTASKMEDSIKGYEASAKHTIAIIKAISKIKVPLKSSPTADIENL